ncbi:MAG: mechanosensitive ion channel family protein, partial [Micromonosporaceae bacterium]
WFVVRRIDRWLARWLHRVGFDTAAQRGGLARVLGSYQASDLVARVVGFGLLLVTLQLAFGIFGPNPVSDVIHAVVAWLPQLFVGLVIVVVAAAIAGWVRDIVAAALAGVSYGRTLATVAQVLILVFGAFAALDQIGVATAVTMPVLIATLATIGGILVVGVGGGLIKPMQHRWERMLIRAETEARTASATVRANRVDRNLNPAGEFTQPAYGQTTTPTAPTATVPTATTAADTDTKPMLRPAATSPAGAPDQQVPRYTPGRVSPPPGSSAPPGAR